MHEIKNLFTGNNFDREMRSKLQEMIPDIIEELNKKALMGNASAAKILLSKIIPDAKEPALQLDIKPIVDLKDVPRYLTDLLAALSNGYITPSQFSKISSGLSTYVNIAHIVEIEERITHIERLIEGDDEIN